MSTDNSDPHEDGLQRLAQLASLLTSAAEAGVRIASMGRRQNAAGSSGPHLTEAAAAVPSAGTSMPPLAPTASSAPGTAALTDSPPGPDGTATTLALRRPHEDLYAVHQDALAFYRAGVRGSWVPGYLASRHLEVALEPPWSAGYAPAGWTALTDHLRSRGWSDEVLVAAGLSRPARTGKLIDHFRDRLVLPIRVRDDIVGFVGRCAEGADIRTPKYLNSPASVIYDKSATLYAARDPRDVRSWGATPVLVEGPLDAIAVSSCEGDRWAGVALCGTAMSKRHIEALVGTPRRRPPTVVVATDHDRAGEGAAETAFKHLAPRGVSLYRLRLPQGQDPADVLRRQGASQLASLIGYEREPLLTSVIDARLSGWKDDLQWIEGRVRAARHVAPLLAVLPDEARAAASHQLAERLDLLGSTVEAAIDQAALSLAPGASRPRRDTDSRSASTAAPAPRPPLRR